MIDLDELERRLEAMWQHHADCTDYHGAATVNACIEVVRAMRAEALPDPSAPAMPRLNRTATTQAMRQAVWPRSGSLRHRLIELLWLDRGRTGFTDDEFERATMRPHTSVSSARNGLVADGWIEAWPLPTGGKLHRTTRAGHAAQVWRLTPAAARRMEASDRA